MSFPRPCATFLQFKKLPVEMRLLIWEFAAQHPRIVHLTKRQLVVDDDPDWWKIVRSDKSNGEPSQCPDDDTESDYGSWYLDENEIEELEWKIASKEALNRRRQVPERYVPSRSQGNCIRGYSTRHGRMPGYDSPDLLYGCKSESGIPGVLLACRESYGVGRRAYTHALGMLGAIPQTYFKFSQDTLYLVEHYRSDYPGIFSTSHKMQFAPDELARVEGLAIRWEWRPYWHDPRDADDALARWCVEKLMPNLKRLTFVDGHYTHQSRAITGIHRSVDDFRELKFMKSAYDSKSCWLVNGFRIDPSLLKGGLQPLKADIEYEIYKAYKCLERDPARSDQAPRKLPAIDIQVIMSNADEDRLLTMPTSSKRSTQKGDGISTPWIRRTAMTLPMNLLTTLLTILTTTLPTTRSMKS